MRHYNMTKKLTIFTILFLVALLSSCYRKILYPYSIHPNIKIDSKVLKLERVSIADTTIAFISGTIYSKDGTDTLYPPLATIGAIVFMIDQRTGKRYFNVTDYSGKYLLHLPTSIYDLKVQYNGYNTLVMRNFILKTGDIMEFNVQLGPSIAERDSSVYEMQVDKTIKLISQPKKTIINE